MGRRKQRRGRATTRTAGGRGPQDPREDPILSLFTPLFRKPLRKLLMVKHPAVQAIRIAVMTTRLRRHTCSDGHTGRPQYLPRGEEEAQDRGRRREGRNEEGRPKQ